MILANCSNNLSLAIDIDQDSRDRAVNEHGSSPSPLDFNLLNSGDEDKSMMSFLNVTAQKTAKSTDSSPLQTSLNGPPYQLVTPPPTNLAETDDHYHENDHDHEQYRDEVECDFCRKVGVRSEFRGRFCSKVCVGRFAQR